MSTLKRIFAGIIATVSLFSLSACGLNTRWSAKTTDDSYNANAGVYIYYLASCYSDGLSQLSSEDSTLDTSDKNAVKNATIEGQNFIDWVKTQALDRLRNHLATEKKFDELGLTLSDDDKTELETNLKNGWSQYGEKLEKNGISEASYKEISEVGYKSQAIFDAYYKDGGIEEVSQDEIDNFITDNYARIKWLTFNLKDDLGNLLTSDEDKAEIKKIAEKYLYKVKSGENMDALISECNESSVSASISASESVSLAEAGDNSDNNSVADGTESPSGGIYRAEEDDDTETTTTTLEDTDSTGEENTDETTTAETSETEETTTTTDPYGNERIIAKGTDGENGEEGTYNPSKLVNGEIFDAVYNQPFLVEDEEIYYVIVRYDILERDDLFDEQSMDTILLQMKSKDFQNMIDDFFTDADMVVNDASYNRYNPLDIDLS